MKTLKTIQAEYAVDNGYSNWDELVLANRDYINDLNEMFEDVAEIYASEMLNIKD